MKPIPEVTERNARRRNVRSIHVHLGEGQCDGDEEKRVDQEKKDDMRTERLSQLPLTIELIENVEKTADRQKLNDDKQAEFDAIGL